MRERFFDTGFEHRQNVRRAGIQSRCVEQQIMEEPVVGAIAERTVKQGPRLARIRPPDRCSADRCPRPPRRRLRRR